MKRDPSWKWLPSRPAVRTSDADIPTRPSMPAMEQLDDRILLSAAPSADAAAGPGGGPQLSTSALIGLLRGELELVKGELSALKLAPAALKVDDVVQLKLAFLKIDDLFLTLGDQAITGDIATKKWPITLKIDQAFLKIDDIVGSAGSDSALLPAVQKVREAATRLQKVLSNTDTQFLKIDNSQLKFVLKLADDALKIDETALKIGLLDAQDLVRILPYIEHKIAEANLKLNEDVDKLGGELKIEGLVPAIQDTLDFLGSFTKRVPTDGLSSLDTSFDGGVTVDDTDDLFA